ncbi:class I tRNA ligase family protein, partial [Buchnera aphidicola (Hormaphis cornu)]
MIHDGPPYANGKIHLGHALNKVLKDIIIKSKSLSGYNVPFVPTWDCHGLPIEHQVEQNIFKKIHNLSNKEFRTKCRSYAHKQVLQQKSDFIRLGIIANWNNPFLTMDFTSEANIVLNLAKIIKKGYVYRDFKPVHWCIQCNSSLAEAELEYLKIECKSIYLTFKGTNSSKFFKKFQLSSNLEIIKLLIWTTTPWSLASNQAIAVHPKIDYQFIQTKTQIFIVAKNIVSKIMDDLNINKWKILGLTQGKNLENLKVCHPFLNVQVPIILSNHVKLDIGTGIVHIASDYGIDDFIACKKYNIKPLNLIDEKGNYSKNIHSLLNGMNIFNT